MATPGHSSEFIKHASLQSHTYGASVLCVCGYLVVHFLIKQILKTLLLLNPGMTKE